LSKKVEKENFMTEEEKKESGEISRREFLKDAGLVVGGAAVGSTVLLSACGGETTTETKTVETTKTVTTTETVEVPVEVQVPEPLTQLTVNGHAYELHVEPYWTLADVLRDNLGLTGTKVGCDEGACGACTVIMDGKPIVSCMTLAVECDGKEITTIEGLAAKDGTLNPLQQAVFDNTGFQCGFCSPGKIMTAQALLNENPSPTEDEVKEALAGHICRCGSFYSFLESVMIAAGGS
jgi:carbon-monoxide dehydrogenase small subunit